MMEYVYRHEIQRLDAIYYMCLVIQSCLTLCDPLDCNPPGSFNQAIFQARILEWLAVPFSRGSSHPRDQTCVSCVSCIAGGFLPAEPLRRPDAIL